MSPGELSSLEPHKEEKVGSGEEENALKDSEAGDTAVSTVPTVLEGGEAADAPAEHAAADVVGAAVIAAAASAPIPATAALTAAVAPPREMTEAERRASANVLDLLQGKPTGSVAGLAKPRPAPRTLSREDALSLCVRATSPPVPRAADGAPVARIHPVHPDSGSPVRPSGEATPPMQTAAVAQRPTAAECPRGARRDRERGARRLRRRRRSGKSPNGEKKTRRRRRGGGGRRSRASTRTEEASVGQLGAEVGGGAHSRAPAGGYGELSRD